MRVWVGDKEIREAAKRIEKRGAILRSNLFRAMSKIVLFVQGEAKKGLPQDVDGYKKGVDTGRLRSSITSKVRQTAFDVEGEVGTNVNYASFVEFGTKRHFVPFRVAPGLLVWARRHGLLKKLVSKSVRRRIRGVVKHRKYLEVMGGLWVSGKPIPFMRPALTRNIPKIVRYLTKIMEAR